MKNEKIICPICSDSKITKIDTKNRIFVCKNCTHSFTVVPKNKQEKYDSEYFDDAHKNWFDNPNYRLFNYIITNIKKRSKDRIRLLDVGCGNGDFLKYIYHRYPSMNLTGIDLVENQHPKIKFIKGDFQTIDNKKIYDAICTLMVVEHLDDPQLFMKKVHDMITDDGILVINTFNSDSLMFRIGRLFKNLGYRKVFDRLYSRHHLQHYTPKALEYLVKSNGFIIIKKRLHNYPMKSVDVPKANFIINFLYRSVVYLIFKISEPLNLGIEQTLICRKTK